MSLIVILLLGAFVGWLAAALLGRDEGFISSMFIGIVGSIIGGFVSTLLTGSDRAVLAFSWGGLVWSLIGAGLLVGLLNLFSNTNRHADRL
jgi:uncharacterized membrane protein YeaQ/YmgE (transglycosylase-associated protein family)